MSSRYARRRDGNHQAIATAFEALGCTVADLSHAGVAGWPDIVVGCLGVNHLVEIKDPGTAYGRAGLNSNQQAFSRDWRGGQVYVVRSELEAQALVSNWRRSTKR